MTKQQVDEAAAFPAARRLATSPSETRGRLRQLACPLIVLCGVVPTFAWRARAEEKLLVTCELL